MTAKEPLTRDAIVTAAVQLADERGLDAVSMRLVAQSLGVQAMSLYHHLPGREALLDGMVDVVFREIELPAQATPWRKGMRERALSARKALLRHPWAVALMDSRSQPGPATLRHHDSVLGCLRRGGFTVAGAAHAFSLLDAYVYGFVIQEAALPFKTAQETAEVTGLLREQLGSQYPNLTEMLLAHVTRNEYDYAAEFEFGLDLILDGLEGLAADGHSAGRGKA